MKKWWGLALILLINQSGHAEYRAFMLHLTNSKTKVVRQMLSTLDPEQYRTLYPLGPDESITYVQTWRCFGRTDSFRTICSKPDKKPARGLSEGPESKPK